MLRLVGSDGARYFAWDLTPGTYLLGRKQDADFCVPNSTVSRRHASIEVAADPETVCLTDLGSHNGTLVNSARVEGTVEVKPGDQIAFGQVEFRIAAEGDTVPPPSAKTLSELADADLEKSVVLSIDEALKPLPPNISDIPKVMTTFSEMARLLVLPEPKEVMLKRSLELVAKVIPAERLAVLFTIENGEGVTCAASVERGGRDHGSFSLSQTLINDILANKNAILIEDSQRDARYARQESVIISGMKSAMAVPLFDEGKVLGILYVDTTNPLHRYTDEYLRLVATFGNIIASRLLNYELWNERQERKVMQAELKRAAQIQDNLLVKAMPQVPEYQVHAFQEQSRQVGGDLYDLYTLPDGRLVFMVADVSGKGMGAALLMANILASFRITYRSRDFELLRAVETVSRELCVHSGLGDFATLFIGMLDPVRHTISYVNAGHPFPMVVHQDGAIDYLESSGLMIGAFEQCAWEEQQIKLHPGSLIFVFSDGVTEARRGEELYDEQRMEPQVVRFGGHPPGEMASLIMQDLADFADDVAGADDITMLIIKRGT
ncbi:SpoIIE family protein phosphatase [Candidatus Zixiibacteriota bacterium]